MKILIVGCLGMLGTDLMAEFSSGHDARGMDLNEINIADRKQCIQRVEEVRPQVIINAAALTRVDYCETHEEEAFLVNGEGAGNLSGAAAMVDAYLVHYSTDYVFDGRKQQAYVEEDPTNPGNVYGKSKLMGEELVRKNCPNHMILRTSWLFGRNGPSFIRAIVNAAKKGGPLRVVNDQKGSPTYTKDLASCTRRLVEAGCRFTYHVTNSGTCTWYELAIKSLEWAGIKGVQIAPVSTMEFASPAPRPGNSVLANTRLEREGFPLMRPWQMAVQEFINFF